MKNVKRGIVHAMCALGVLASAHAEANHAQHHATVVNPGAVRWTAAPSVFPSGTQIAVIFGNPEAQGPFVLRLRLANGAMIPLHHHDAPETVTVLKGAVHLVTRHCMGGEGGSHGTSGAQPHCMSNEHHVTAGGFFAVPAHLQHHVTAMGETVVQVNGTGPWSLHLVEGGGMPRH